MSRALPNKAPLTGFPAARGRGPAGVQILEQMQAARQPPAAPAAAVHPDEREGAETQVPRVLEGAVAEDGVWQDQGCEHIWEILQPACKGPEPCALDAPASCWGN